MSRRGALSTEPSHRGMHVLAAAGLLTVGALVSACGPDASGTSAANAAGGTSVSTEMTGATSASESSAAADAANAAQDAQNQAAAAAASAFAMPNLVGMDLQTAQNTIQTHGVFYSRSHDLRGSRHQVLDSNWLVCTQNIPTGQQVTPGQSAEGQIDLGVVKRGETCP